MSAVDDVARMLALVPWLLERPGATVQETAAVFGVAESKVREDLYHLDFCGLPGLGGGDLFDVSIVADRIVVSMADELREPLRLTPVEALRLVLIAEAVRDAVAGDLPELDGAIAKLRAAADVPRGVSVELDDTGARWLVPIRRAIESDRTVTFAYRGRADDAPQSRTVDPWGLTVAEGFWYVQGHDHGAGARRTFRLDRVADLEVGDQPRTHPTGVVEAPRYRPSEGDVEVVLRVEARAAWLAEAIDVAEASQEGPVLVLRFSTDALSWVSSLVLTAGAGVRVEQPTELRELVVAEAQAALSRYAGSAGTESSS